MSASPQVSGTPLVARRTVVDIVDTGLAFCRMEFPAILGIVLALQGPNVVLKYLAYRLDLIPFDRIFNSFSFQETASYTVPNILLMLVEALIYVLVNAALCIFVDGQAMGETRRIASCVEAAVTRAMDLAKVSLISLAMIAAGLMACLIPGMAFYALFLFTTPIVMIEGPRAWNAVLKRSRDLASGDWWRVVGFLLLTVFLLGVLGISLTFLLSAAFGVVLEQMSWLSGLLPDENWILMISGLLVSLMLFPLEMIFIMLLYYDIRSRREGLDLMHLMNRAHA